MRPAILRLTVFLIALAILLLNLATRQLNHQKPPSNRRTSLLYPFPMDSEVLHQFIFFNVLKDGRVNIFSPPQVIVPPADDPTTGVNIKDVQISSLVSARVFLPPLSSPTDKLPLLLYVHGGGFCMQSAFNAEYTAFVTHLAAQARVLAVSVEYGLFPARPIPACYDDSWEALRWLASHARGSGPDPWLKHHGDFSRVFLAGDSAGGNICHTLAVRAGTMGLPNGVEVDGMILIHPYFGEDDKMWMYMCPTNEGPRDRRMRGSLEDMARLGCRRVLVLVAEKDPLKPGGVRYVEELRQSGWKGTVEMVENKDKEHCFHISNHRDQEAVANLRRMVSFINHRPQRQDQEF